jgi:hypothetical protein
MPQDFFVWALYALAIFIFLYAVARGMSFAYFRTKLEYLRAAMKELKKGEHDGEV